MKICQSLSIDELASLCKDCYIFHQGLFICMRLIFENGTIEGMAWIIRQSLRNYYRKQVNLDFLNTYTFFIQLFYLFRLIRNHHILISLAICPWYFIFWLLFTLCKILLIIFMNLHYQNIFKIHS